MAILIIEHRGTVEGASLSGRVLIGRRVSNHVVVDDDTVSRIHAWIDTAGSKFCLTDADSRTGTYVNGERIRGKVDLRHGDQIAVGPARLTFRSDGSLPAGVSQLDFGLRDAAALTDGGILFDCLCGAPLWINSDFAGRLGKCRFCGEIIQVPQKSGEVALPAPGAMNQLSLFTRQPGSTNGAPVVPASATVAFCGACQSAIEGGEASTQCPDCGLTFHRDCWNENFGCSAYGCSQVNVLLPESASETASETSDANLFATSLPEEGPESASKVPAEFALLGGSIVALMAGMFTFGVPALLALALILLYLKRRRGQPIHRAILAAGAVALIGVVVGIAISYIWWLRDAAAAGNVLDIGSSPK